MSDIIRQSYSSPAPSSSYFLPPTPPPGSNSSKGPRRPSISVAMSWLTHKSSSSVTSINSNTSSRFATSQAPLRISEPRLIEEPAPSQSLSKFSGRGLGMGAEVVKTPQQALQGARGSPPRRDLPPIPASPPPALRPSKSSPHLQQPNSKSPAEVPPPLPARRPSPKGNPHAVAPITPVPTPPLQTLTLVDPIPEAADVPTFEPVLLSPSSPSIPSNVKPSQFPVTLETSTSTFRTTLHTLLSHPSHLKNYLESIMESPTLESSPSSANAPSPFTQAFNEHLISEGVNFHKASPNALHLFLDRPSSPYFYILSFLRTPTSSPQALPRAVQINPHSTSSPSSSKLESLMELRDEARYLGLEALEKLCNDEIRLWFSARRTFHNRNGSNVSLPLRPQRHQALMHPINSQTTIGSNQRASSSTTALPWESDFGTRTSVECSSDCHQSEVDLPIHSPPPTLSSQMSSVVGLGLRTRSRSNSRTDPTTRPGYSAAVIASTTNLRTSHPSASRSANWI